MRWNGRSERGGRRFRHYRFPLSFPGSDQELITPVAILPRSRLKPPNSRGRLFLVQFRIHTTNPNLPHGNRQLLG
jgi:hypothetical protein